MASGSSARIEDLEYLYASNANVSNFVSVKLSSVCNYHLWKTQMLCLMKSHKMGGLVDGTLACPRTSGKEIMEQYNNLLKGWIFGSVSEDILGSVADLDAAKEVWDKLKSLHDPTQQDSEPTLEAKGETKDIEVVAAKINTTEKDETAIKVTDELEGTPLIVDPVNITPEEKKELRNATMKGDWTEAEQILKRNGDLARAEISSDGSTVLHIAVGRAHNDFLEKLFSHIKNDDLLAARSSDGCTALHIAGIVGNKHAAELLVTRNKELLEVKDYNGEDPLYKAYKNMHLETIEYLLRAIYDDANSKSSISSSFADPVRPENRQLWVDVLVNAISARQYNLALRLAKAYPKFATEKDHVLMAIAQNFPKGLNHLETLMYPSLKNAWDFVSSAAILLVGLLLIIPGSIYDLFHGNKEAAWLIISLLLIPVVSVILPIAMVWLLFLVLYWLLCKGAMILPLAPIEHIKNKKNEWDEATKVLELVCVELEKEEAPGTYHPHYERPVLEASCQNAYKVVDEILFRSPEAIDCKNESGYDIIQLAIIHRSEKIYNLIYDIGERKTLYRTVVDSANNNILHLAGRLAPPSKLAERRGAVLQLQRELQWREDVKKHIFPTYLTQKNSYGETPDMVFTKEHENLVKEGEKWMKTTAESCSITAALITTIVFAAAITVPGGSNQETGIPLFT